MKTHRPIVAAEFEIALRLPGGAPVIQLVRLVLSGQSVSSMAGVSAMPSSVDFSSALAGSTELNEAAAWPRIALVTPVLNAATYVEQTILSVLTQGYPNLEYIIVDGGSTDGTVEIIHKYESQLAWWVSEPDKGMYDAVNKGFARSTGEIMGWISGTDMLHSRSLFAVGSILRTFPNVDWITGLPTVLDEQGMIIRVLRVPHWSRYRYLAGANRYVQQESTFWRRSLWEKAGGYVDASRRMASDFELWVRFFRYACLYPVNAVIGGYRLHYNDSLGLQDLEECHRIHDSIIQAELDSIPGGKAVSVFRRVNGIVQRIPKVRRLWRELVVRGLYRLPGPDWPPIIEYQVPRGWVMRRGKGPEGPNFEFARSDH